jgi:hypothetical protein
LKLKKRKKRKTEKKTHHRLGTSVRDIGVNAGLLAGNQFATGKSCNQPTRTSFSVVLLAFRSNAELVSKFHVALHASHAAFPVVALKISLCTDVILTFDFDFGLHHHVHGGYG